MTRETDIREDIELYLDVLVKLHDETDPARGKASEKDKLIKARHAVEIWWRLYDRLVFWAQSHLR